MFHSERCNCNSTVTEHWCAIEQVDGYWSRSFYRMLHRRRWFRLMPRNFPLEEECSISWQCWRIAGKLTGESCDVFHKITGVCHDHDQENDRCPDTNPTAKIHVIKPVGTRMIDTLRRSRQRDKQWFAYVQKLLTMVSKTSTGPVLPRIVNGWPANRWYKQPQMAPERRLSIAA